MFTLIKWPGLGQAEPKFKIKFFFFHKPDHLFFFEKKKPRLASTTHYCFGPINFILQKLQAQFVEISLAFQTQ